MEISTICQSKENSTMALPAINAFPDELDSMEDILDNDSLDSMFRNSVFPVNKSEQVSRSISMAQVGNSRVKQLIRAINLLGYRSDIQIMFHGEFIKASLAHLYGSAYDAMLPSLLNQFNVDRIEQETFCVMNRRNGKTFAVAMFAAAYLWVVPKCSITVFSHGIAMSSKLSALITDLVFELKRLEGDNGAHFAINNSSTKVLMRDGASRRLECKTDSGSYARGYGSNITIIDEAAQVPEKFVFSVVFPTLTVKEYCLISITSPVSDSWVMDVIDAKRDDGSSFVNSLKIVDICDDCMQLPYNERYKCDHVRPPPFWKSGEKQRKIGELSEKMKQTGTFLQEVKGMDGVVTNQPLFVDIHLKRFFANIKTISSVYTEFLFISIDPSGKESGASCTGVTTLYVNNGGDIVVCFNYFFIIHITIFWSPELHWKNTQ
jgi:hypothetical protein